MGLSVRVPAGDEAASRALQLVARYAGVEVAVMAQDVSEVEVEGGFGLHTACRAIAAASPALAEQLVGGSAERQAKVGAGGDWEAGGSAPGERRRRTTGGRAPARPAPLCRLPPPPRLQSGWPSGTPSWASSCWTDRSGR